MGLDGWRIRSTAFHRRREAALDRVEIVSLQRGARERFVFQKHLKRGMHINTFGINRENVGLPLTYSQISLVIVDGCALPSKWGQWMSLLLDSGANQLTLFKDDLGPGENQAERILTGSFNQWVASSVATRRVRSLDLRTTSVPELTVIALSRRVDVDSDGLIPASLFHSVFISHFRRFVILNPSFPKTSRDAPVAPAAR